MDLLLENELLKYKTHLIDHATLSSILLNRGYTSIKDKIKLLKKKNIIKTLKKGFYVHTSPVVKNIISKEIIANNLLGPSYISFDYALHYYNLIPESVHEISSATSKRTKSFTTDYGIFSYRSMKTELYGIGLIIQESNNGNFIIATKEKALCDKVYFTKDIKINSKKDMYAFLENDLRLDFEELEDFNMEIIEQYLYITKSKKIKILLKIIKELVYDNS
jgi:predicted transcriptional regulator of viral defense system